MGGYTTLKANGSKTSFPSTAPNNDTAKRQRSLLYRSVKAGNANEARPFGIFLKRKSPSRTKKKGENKEDPSTKNDANDHYRAKRFRFILSPFRIRDAPAPKRASQHGGKKGNETGAEIIYGFHFRSTRKSVLYFQQRKSKIARTGI